ncbi:MAG TPA: trigger factor [Solirubrobacteraceae bacterium]|jgi:trigger factor|nr:trigger factor [Solirubrobacteraceae bacterium]
MAPDVTTTVTELPESRVRVQAEVPSEEVERRVAQAAKRLGRNLRVPGFRAGKAPPPVIVQRMGRDAVLDEAVRDSIGVWYTAAIDAARIAPVGEPELDLGDLPRQGEPLRFSIEIGVRPKAELGDYKGVEVGKRDPQVDDEAIGAEIDRLRERSARLDTVDRPAGSGDFVVMDYKGTLDGEAFAGGEGRDQMVELGSGRLVPGFEDQLDGAKAGEERTVTVTFPDDYGAEELAGREAEFAVSVKEVKAKELPELDDDLAAEAGFDTLDELREDIRTRLSEAETARIDAEFREAALDSAVKNAKVEVPDALVEARAREQWDQMLHSLAHQGISREAYLRIAGRDENEIVEQAKPDAEQALRREAVLAAIIEAEGIEPSDDEVREAVEEAAGDGPGSVPPKKLMERLRSSGRIDQLKQDLAQRKALDLIAESAKAISIEQARARDKLWTPGHEEQGSSAQLWTPSS